MLEQFLYAWAKLLNALSAAATAAARVANNSADMTGHGAVQAFHKHKLAKRTRLEAQFTHIDNAYAAQVQAATALRLQANAIIRDAATVRAQNNIALNNQLDALYLENLC